jgi:hypothetical protein
MAMVCSRRELARMGLCGAVAALPGALAARDALAGPAGDASLLEHLVALEQRSVLAYTAAADDGRLGAFEPVARLLAEQEQEHAEGLGRALRRLGGAPPRADDSPPAAASSGLRALAGLAVELETTLVAAYQDALARLDSPELISTAASVVASHAQHLVVLRQALGLDPSPHAFVTGAQ